MKEEMETIKLRSGNQLARENYLLLNKSKAQILNILLNTEEKMEDLQSQLKAKEEENEQLKADYGNLAQVERDLLKEVIKEIIEYLQSKEFKEQFSAMEYKIDQEVNMKLRRIKEILHVCEKTIDNYANRIGASDEIVEYIENLQSQLKAKEEVIEEAREYIEKCNKEEGLSMYVDTWQHLLPILEILSKGENK